MSARVPLIPGLRMPHRPSHPISSILLSADNQHEMSYNFPTNVVYSVDMQASQQSGPSQVGAYCLSRNASFPVQHYEETQVLQDSQETQLPEERMRENNTTPEQHSQANEAPKKTRKKPHQWASCDLDSVALRQQFIPCLRVLIENVEGLVKYGCKIKTFEQCAQTIARDAEKKHRLENLTGSALQTMLDKLEPVMRTHFNGSKLEGSYSTGCGSLEGKIDGEETLWCEFLRMKNDILEEQETGKSKDVGATIETEALKRIVEKRHAEEPVTVDSDSEASPKTDATAASASATTNSDTSDTSDTNANSAKKSKVMQGVAKKTPCRNTPGRGKNDASSFGTMASDLFGAITASAKTASEHNEAMKDLKKQEISLATARYEDEKKTKELEMQLTKEKFANDKEARVEAQKIEKMKAIAEMAKAGFTREEIQAFLNS